MGAHPELFSLYSAFPIVYPSPQGVCSRDVVGQAPRTSKSEKCLIRKLWSQQCGVNPIFFTFISGWVFPAVHKVSLVAARMGLFLVGELGLLIRVASRAAEHGL